MLREVLTGKIHKANVTEANLAYVGSITIDSELMKYADLWPGQKVLVVSNTSGARVETYVIEGDAKSGIICMNGAAAHHIKQGDEIIIMGFALSDRPWMAKNVLVNKTNQFVRYLNKEDKVV
ncbi:MAG: aspartate 1-decarboxylase [Bacteriovoracaceae bacterium]|nr:aspartate 1-decarboxylase [Bacteriovoracaceae bacterium]